METMTDTMEQAPKNYFLLGDRAQGLIEAGPDQQERLNEFTDRVASGEFHVLTEGKIAFGCIDGRDTRDGIVPKPDSAGGSESLMVADDLTFKRFAGESGTTAEAFETIVGFAVENGYEVGGHTDEHASGVASGCGANDKLPLIYKFIAENSSYLFNVAETLGVPVSEENAEMITSNAKARTQFSDGRELLDVLREHGDDKADILTGEHNEVAAVINTKEGTTLDRVALAKEFGTDYEAFNVDVWTFNEAAELITSDPDEIAASTLAMTVYNLATAHVLCGTNMRVIVR